MSFSFILIYRLIDSIKGEEEVLFGRNKTEQSQVIIKEQHKESRKERREREQAEKEAEEQRKEQFALEEQSLAFEPEYMGGHKLYRKKQVVRVLLKQTD